MLLSKSYQSTEPGRKAFLSSTISAVNSIVLFFCAVTIICTMAAVQADEKIAAALRAVSDSNLKFTNSIYQILAKKEGNIFFSPISIEVILALAYMGAKGKTAEQMSTGLHLPADKELAKEGFNALMTSLKSDEHITLEIANKIFAEQTFSMLPDFVATAQKHFVSDAQTVDFRTNAEAARKLINGWVEGKTNNKIKELLAEGIVNAETALVLVNAVYFKGNWAIQFDKNMTTAQPFYVTATETKDVEMMHLKKKFNFTYIAHLDSKVLELPYLGDKLSLVIMLPNAVDGLPALEAKLPELNLREIMGSLDKMEVEVTLPKFKLEQFTNLNAVLKELGMTEMFENSADFSGITETGPGVKVSNVVHKAFIEVNEEGSEAAAATATIMMCRMAFLPGPDFVADHPFIYTILDKLSGSPLFMGRFSRPE